MEFKPANRKECSLAIGSNLTLNMTYAPNMLYKDEITCSYTITGSDGVVASSYSTFDPDGDIEYKMKRAGLRFAYNYVAKQRAILESAEKEMKPLLLMFGLET